jgi:hypothetical protein
MAIWVRICQVDRHRPFEADWLVCVANNRERFCDILDSGAFLASPDRHREISMVSR